MKIGALAGTLALCLVFGCSQPDKTEISPPADLIDQAMMLLESDPLAARQLVEQYAAVGDAEAMNALSLMLRSGSSEWEADIEKADELEETAIKAGSRAAGLNFAQRALLDSEGDHERAIELLRKADEDELFGPMTAYSWGRAYLFGWGVEPDMAKGVGLLESFLQGSDSLQNSEALWTVQMDAQFLLGGAYQNGWDVPVDPARAYRHMRAAADLGDPRAQWNTGMMLLAGAGAIADESEAYRYVKLASEGGYLDGMISRAVMLASGEGLAEDDVAAREWYYRAAQQGSAHALRGLGYMLVTGEGGPVNIELGVALLELAVDAREENAAILLGFIPPERLPAAGDVEAAKQNWLKDHPPPDPVQ